MDGVKTYQDPGCRALASLLVAALVVGCASPTSSPQSDSRDVSRAGLHTDPDKLVLVDCLLPGQIRQLGSGRSYVTPRRPVKTTAGDCEIRGGEYVAFDRASYATALTIWLPQAEAGDPVAQTYVGEIYERGLGLAPNYTLAAEWYRKAAAQDHAPAQANLGYLFEKGLGVPQDKKQALDLYRRASGLQEDLAYASEVAAVRARAESEIQILTEELARQAAETERLRRELEESQRRLQDRTGELDATRLQLQRARQAYEDLRSRGRLSDDERASLARLEREIQQYETELQAARAEVAALQETARSRQQEFDQQVEAARAQQARLRSELERQKQALDSQQQQSQVLAQQLGQSQLELAETRQSLSEAELELVEQRALYAEQQRRLAEQRRALAQQQQTDRQSTGVIETLRTELARSERELAASEQRVSDLQRALEREAQSRSEQVSEEVASLEQALQMERASVASASERIRALEAELAAYQVTGDEQATTIGTLRGELDEAEQLLTARQRRIAALETEVGAYSKQVAELERRQQIQAPAQESFVDLVREQVPLGNYHGLIIGNSSYQSLPALRSPVEDAKAVDRLLRERYGYQTTLLLNATRGEIYQALDDFRHRLTASDNLLMYYAGHGRLGADGVQGYWLPVDSDDGSRGNWISNREIADQLKEMRAKHVLVLADACYSDRMTNPPPEVNVVTAGSTAARLQRLTSLAQLRVRMVLRSGGEQPVPGQTGIHSIFATALLAELEDNRGVLEGQVLASRVSNRIRAMLADLKQPPGYDGVRDAGHLFGDYLFVPAI